MNVNMLVSQFGYNAPFLLVYVIGLVFCFIKMKDCPKAAKLAMASLGALVLLSLFGMILQTVLISQAMNGNVNPNISSISGGCFSFLKALATGGVIAAVFAGRTATVPGPADRE